jgi:hypothetical protein
VAVTVAVGVMSGLASESIDHGFNFCCFTMPERLIMLVAIDSNRVA